MSEKVLGFYKKDAGITCAKCYCVYCDEAKCPAPSCGEINKEDIITLNRSELVPVRLKSESVDLKWLEDYCKMHSYYDDNPWHDEDVVSVSSLLCAVRAKAKAEAGKK